MDNKYWVITKKGKVTESNKTGTLFYHNNSGWYPSIYNASVWYDEDSLNAKLVEDPCIFFQENNLASKCQVVCDFEVSNHVAYKEINGTICFHDGVDYTLTLVHTSMPTHDSEISKSKKVCYQIQGPSTEVHILGLYRDKPDINLDTLCLNYASSKGLGKTTLDTVKGIFTLMQEEEANAILEFVEHNGQPHKLSIRFEKNPSWVGLNVHVTLPTTSNKILI